MNTIPIKISERTGRKVIDDNRHETWREQYWKKFRDSENEAYQQAQRALHDKNLSPVNILTTTQVAEYFGCTKSTAYLYMKSGIIPSFQLGRYWYTHDYVIDNIEKKARELLDAGFAKRSYPRMVWKSEEGKKW